MIKIKLSLNLLILLIGYVSAMISVEKEQSVTTSQQEELLIVGIPFDCTNKPTGFYKDPKYCDIFHVCVGFVQRKTYGCPQSGNRFYYDESLKMCEFKSRNPNGCPLNTYYQQVIPQKQIDTSPVTNEPVQPWKQFIRQLDTEFTCQGKSDGFFPSRWCNVFYRCASGTRFEFLCAKQTSGDRLWWNDHSTKSQSLGKKIAECSFPCDINRECKSPGGILIEKNNGTVITESKADANQILETCKANKNNKGDLTTDKSGDTFQLPSDDQLESTSCLDKPDGSFQSDDKYCNVFHVCYAGTKRDFLCAKAINSDYELWWDASKNRCDWPCKVKCQKQVFGGSKSAAAIQRRDNIINAADCQVSIKSIKYSFLNRAFIKK